jgi:hypothetical protein
VPGPHTLKPHSLTLLLPVGQVSDLPSRAKLRKNHTNYGKE